MDNESIKIAQAASALVTSMRFNHFYAQLMIIMSFKKKRYNNVDNARKEIMSRYRRNQNTVL